MSDQNNYENTSYNEAHSQPTSFVTYIPYGFTPETYKEKKEIRKTAIIIGTSMLILMGIMFLWATVFFAVAGFLGLDILKIQKLLTDPAALQVMQIVLSSLMFTVPFIAVFKIGGMRISDLIPLSLPEKGNRASLFFIGVSFCAFANIASSYAGQFFKSFGINYNVDYGENPEGVFGFLLSLIASAVVPALVEEFACRGLVLGSLKKFGESFAILVSSILFGLMHGNFDQMPFAFMVGLILGFITVKTNSIWIAVAVHFTNNFISVAFNYIFAAFSDNTQNLIYSVYLMAALLLGIIFTALSSKSNIFTLEESTTASSFKQKFKWFFTSALIIIFIVICVLESLVYFG